METIDIKDKSGYKITLKVYDGIKFSPNAQSNMKDHLRDIGNIEYSDDDVLLLSYPKSGTHWVREVISMVKQGKAEYYQHTTLRLEFATVEKLLNADSPRLLESHLFPRHLPKSFLDQRCKIVYIYRNPKDLSVSMYAFVQNLKRLLYGGQWDDFLELWLQGDFGNSWFTYTKDMAQFIKENPSYPILVVSYEDMKKDLQKEVKRVATFLQCDIDEDVCKQIADKCQFAAMMEEKNKNISEKEKAISGTGKNVYYRKGEVGDWKNWFTVAMNEMFDRVYEKEMADVDLDVKFCI